MTNNYLTIRAFHPRGNLAEEAMYFFDSADRDSMSAAVNRADRFATVHETNSRTVVRSSCYPCPALGREYSVIVPAGRPR
jgi:hypothetical protein